ncbi:MAG: methyltransferase domain-containing protein [Bacteroidota bacterium]
MALVRMLEAEVMDTREDALEYDAMDFTEVNTSFVERAVQLAPERGTVLDIGTGTARIPILLARRRPFWRITAIDLSSNMLHVGEQNVREVGLEKQITLKLVDAKRLPFQDGEFDTVVSNSIVHHIPDPGPFFHEFKRVVAQGGAILVRDLFRPDDEATLNEIVAKVCVNDTEYQTKLFRDSLHAAFTLEEVRQLASTAGLHDVRIYQSSDRHWTLERSFSRPA